MRKIYRKLNESGHVYNAKSIIKLFYSCVTTKMEPELNRNFCYFGTFILVSHASPIGLLTLYCNIKLDYFLP